MILPQLGKVKIHVLIFEGQKKETLSVFLIEYIFPILQKTFLGANRNISINLIICNVLFTWT